MKPAAREAGPYLAFGLLVILLLLTAGYIGSYYALVERRQGVGVGNNGILAVSLKPQYGLDSDVPAYIYYPVHQFDCWLRPQYWTAN